MTCRKFSNAILSEKKSQDIKSHMRYHLNYVNICAQTRRKCRWILQSFPVGYGTVVFKRCLIFILSHKCVSLPKLIVTRRKTNGSVRRGRAEGARFKLACELLSNADITLRINACQRLSLHQLLQNQIVKLLLHSYRS